MKVALRDKKDRMRRFNICLIIVLEGGNGKNGKEVFRGNDGNFFKIDEKRYLGSILSFKG